MVELFEENIFQINAKLLHNIKISSWVHCWLADNASGVVQFRLFKSSICSINGKTCTKSHHFQ